MKRFFNIGPIFAMPAKASTAEVPREQRILVEANIKNKKLLQLLRKELKNIKKSEKNSLQK